MSRRPAGAAARPVVVPGSVDGVNLLPASVRGARELAALRRRLALGIAGLAAVVAVGYGALVVQEQEAQALLDEARAETVRLTAEVAQYDEVVEVRSATERVTAARAVGMGTEILWIDVIRSIESVIAQDTTIASFSASGISAAEGGTFAAQDPLGTSGIAAITFSVRTPTLPDTAAWLDALNGVPGLMDATYSSASRTDGTGGPAEYLVASTVQVDVGALSLAYVEGTTAAEDAG